MLPKSQTAPLSGDNALLRLDVSGPVWVLHVDDSAPFEVVRRELGEALNAHADGLHGRNIHLGLGDRTIDLFDVRRISSQLRETFQASVVAVICTAQSIHRHVEGTFKLKIIPEGVYSPVIMPIGFDGAPLAAVPEIEAPEIEAPEVEIAETAEIDPVLIEGMLADAESESESESECVTELVAADTLEPVTQESADVAIDEAVPTDLPEFADVEATDIVELNPSPENLPIPGEGGRRVMVVERTLRSGNVIRFAGDVTVFGDVNAGAQIEADGNITVMGSLRGLAHAGARGDNRAVIIAFDMDAPQLRIAERIGFCSQPPAIEEPPAPITLKARFQTAALGQFLRRDRPTHRTYTPEIAWIDGGQIRFETYDGRLPT